MFKQFFTLIVIIITATSGILPDMRNTLNHGQRPTIHGSSLAGSSFLAWNTQALILPLTQFHGNSVSVQTDQIEAGQERSAERRLRTSIPGSHMGKTAAIVTITALTALSIMNIPQFVLGPLHLHHDPLAAANLVGIGAAYMFLAFPVSVIVQAIFNLVMPPNKLLEASSSQNPYYAGVPHSEPKQIKWPPVTIQIPVYKESFEEVIRPTLEHALAAKRAYQAKGGIVNIVVSDDGLMAFANDQLEKTEKRICTVPNSKLSVTEREIKQRLNFYQSHHIGFVARSKDQRAGLFKKASNLNFTMAIADELEKKAGPLGERQIRPSDVQSSLKTLEKAVRQTRKQQKRWRRDSINIPGFPAVARGDVRIGEYIFLLDKDSEMPAHVIAPTILEFLNDSRLGYTQHKTRPTNSSENYFAGMIGHFTWMLYELIFPFTALRGEPPPLVGHNACIRKKAMQDIRREEAHGIHQYWTTNRVSEDFELLLKVLSKGYIGRYVTFMGLDFGEGVTRTFREEALKWSKFAYGALELILNPIQEWLHGRFFTSTFREYLRAPSIPWHAKFHMLVYFSTYFAVASIVITFPMQLMLVAAGLAWGHVAVSSLWILLQNTLTFSIISPIAIVLLRGRLRTVPDFQPHIQPLGSRLWRELRFIALFFAFFSGLSLSFARGVYSYLLGIKLSFGATNIDPLEQPPFRHVLYQTLVDNRLQLAIALADLLFIGWAYDHWHLVPFWHIFGGATIFGVAHLLNPFIYNPVFVSSLVPKHSIGQSIKVAA